MASDNRTEKATPRRRQRATDQGQFPYSQEVTGALTLLTSFVAVYYVYETPKGFRLFFESIVKVAFTANSDLAFQNAVRQAGIYFLMACAPIFGVAVVAALVGNVIQGLPVFAKDGVGLKFERLNPIQGLSRLKTKISPLEWGKMLVLLVVAGAVLWTTFQLYWTRLVAAPALPLESSNALVREMVFRIVEYLGVTMVVMAVADFFLQRYRFEESIKQTKAEVKEDAKSTEGNPAVKGKIRSIQRETARRRMMDRVKMADVIVTNPTHYAVALEYKPETMAAPRVIAKGRGWLAQKIKEVGREHDIPTVENVPLARALYRSVHLEQEIPGELYKAVAEVLAFVFKARNRK